MSTATQPTQTTPPQTKRYELPGGYIDVRTDAHCPFALYSVLGNVAHGIYFAIPRRLSFAESCAFIEQHPDYTGPTV
jgi:hypothetical protein